MASSKKSAKKKFTGSFLPLTGKKASDYLSALVFALNASLF
jgi:hypothetical protein